MVQYGFFFDQSRCYGCQACSIACKDWNDIAPGPEKWMCVYEWETGTFPTPRLHELAFSCGHCEDPACVKACAHGAIFKDDEYGAVLIDQDKCQGDRNCFAACPYGAIKFASDDPGTKASKCTMCIDRLEKGQMPLCVESCPMRALDFGPIEELRAKYGDCAQLADMPAPVTKPAWVAKPQEEKKQLIPFDVDEAIRLSMQRGELPAVYKNEADLTPEEGVIRRNKLIMKNATVAEVMVNTTNNQG